MSAANAKREAPQLKAKVTEALAKWNKRLVDSVVENGSLDAKMNSTLLEMVRDLEEIKTICEKRGRY